jgi:hypothetical protein
MKRCFVILVWFSLSCVAYAQECRPLIIDGTSEVMVKEERQNYLANLPSRLTKDQETLATKIMTDLAFAKYAEDGCYVRAHVLADQLAKAGIVDTYKTWLFAPSNYTFFLNGFIKPKAGGSQWNYHVAVSFVSANGTHMIIDSAVDSQKPISYDGWLSKLQCSEGSIMLRTDRSRWLPATVTTDEKMPKQDYFSHGRNPFNGFIFTNDKDTPDIVANHLARDDVADRFASCSSIASQSAKALLERLMKGDAFQGNGCTDVPSYFNERRQHWKSLLTTRNPTK